MEIIFLTFIWYSARKIHKFNSVWEQRKLGEIGTAKSGTGFPDVEQGGTEGIPFFKVSDMNTPGNEYELNVANNYVTEEQINRKRWNVIDDIPAIFFAKVGAAVMLNRKRLVRFPFLLDNNTMAYIFDKNIWDCDFGKTLFETIDLTKLTQVGALPSYNASDVEDICITIPHKAEQEVIGKYFSNLDNLITLHQRKIVYLNDIYTFVWEQRKLLGCIEKITDFRGRTPKKLGMDWSESGYLALSALNVKDGYIDFSQNVHYGDQALYDKWMNGNELHEGQVLFTTEAPMGNVAQVPDNKRYILSQRTIAFDVKEDIITENFLATLLRSPVVFNTLSSLSSGGTAKGVSQKSLADVNVKLPVDLREQTLLADYFHNLDHLITLHHRKSYICFKLKTFVWEQRKLNEIADKVTEKNKNNDFSEPFTNSAEQGIVSQKDYFDREIVNNENLNGYYIVRNNDFIYNPRISVSAPVGPINRNRLRRNGVMSPLYTVFRTHDIDHLYLEFYFKTTSWHRFMKLNGDSGARFDRFTISSTEFMKMPIPYPRIEEQKKIGKYFDDLDKLITLHHRKSYICSKLEAFDWEQRKLGELADIVGGGTPSTGVDLYWDGDIDWYTPAEIGEQIYLKSSQRKITEEGLNKSSAKILPVGTVLFTSRAGIGKTAILLKEGCTNQGFQSIVPNKEKLDSYFIFTRTEELKRYGETVGAGSTFVEVSGKQMANMELMMPKTMSEQQQIGEYFANIDHLITLHHRKQKWAKYVLKFFEITIITGKERGKMPELEKIIEDKLIDQLVYGESQWIYRDDLKTEEDLWKNFKYILEQNNKDRLNGETLSDGEFEQVKNQLQFSSFYKAGEWLVGENGKAMVHIQRDTERLHLVVMNHEHIAGGSSVYEVINQYSALKTDDVNTNARDRRFDVTLMINGLPMIHIELKNRQHSYMDAFWQIKKYISEGKFTGIFSAVQMFVVSNGVDTKYFAAASDTELNPKFMSGWVDVENNPVSNYIDFAKSVLRIPEAHEMIARYTVLDEDAKRLILLRPYQIHAIESIREASKQSSSGFVWHTTGSGKTLTSYKATRNLLMDIPAIDKAIFLIDRKDLDTQTTMAFQAYANNDLVDVDETDNVNDLKKKLKSDDRQVIVTTIQKMQILINKRLQEGTTEYSKIKNLKIAFVVDECHRAVTPKTKREIERFFGRSLWYGFTGTPRFAENPYPQMGDLPRTTEELYGKRLHKYTIQNAIHDNAVLGFQVEHNGPTNMDDEASASAYDNETHMLRVLDIILNKSYHKLGFQNGKGKTYEGLLTTSSIQLAQKYYDLLTKVKNGETSLEIDERIKQVLPDFPKFAITYSVTENEEGSHVNQEKMQKSLDDYNKMFGTKYELSQIQGYNGNLNKRLARKDAKYKSRNEQLDLVIVVDRLLTGFDAPCMSTIFIDRQPMGPHDLIQAFSRTNRIFDKNKTYGQIVTFQAPKLFKESVDNAVKLYSAGSTEEALVAEWEEVEPAFRKALAALRVSAETPEAVVPMSLKEKKVFVKMFQLFDRLFAQLKSFTKYEDSLLNDYGITEEEYDRYAGVYKNAMEEIKIANGEGDDPVDVPPEEEVDVDYQLMAYSSTKIDYEYIINLIQNIVTPDEDAETVSPEERQKQIDEVRQYVEEMQKDNPKVAEIMFQLINEIEQDENKYKGQSILHIVENMKHACIDKVVSDFCITWYASKEDVMYAALNYRNGEIPNESVIKATIDYQSYKAAEQGKVLQKFKYYSQCMSELRKILEEEIKPLISVA